VAAPLRGILLGLYGRRCNGLAGGPYIRAHVTRHGAGAERAAAKFLRSALRIAAFGVLRLRLPWIWAL
jgi:hypothetical protein